MFYEKHFPEACGRSVNFSAKRWIHESYRFRIMMATYGQNEIFEWWKFFRVFVYPIFEIGDVFGAEQCFVWNRSETYSRNQMVSSYYYSE